MTSPESPGRPAPGWYADPSGSGSERLFDGIMYRSETRRPRPPFAAKFAHRTAGIWLAVVGGLCALIFVAGIPALVQRITPGGLGSLAFWLIVGGGLLTWSVYLLRGQGFDPAPFVQSLPSRLQIERDLNAWLDRAAALPRGAAAVSALANAQGASRALGLDGDVGAGLQARDVDLDKFDSPFLGRVPTVDGAWLEVFRDWVLLGVEARDVDEHTHMAVYLDGQKQLVTRQVVSGNEYRTVSEEVDFRQAAVHVVSDSWSMQASIHPDDVDEARRVREQLERHVARLAPRAASAADIAGMVDTILGNTGQPLAEKLTQLSNLRYDRILSDAEFEEAKARLLASPGASVNPDRETRG